MVTWPGEVHAVGDDDVIAQDAVVSEVDISHQQAVGAHGGLLAIRSATVDGHALADGGAITYFSGGVFTGELEVLRDRTDDGTGEDPALFADARAVHQHGVGSDPTAVTDHHIAVHTRKGFHGDVLAELRIGVDVGEFRDAHRAGACAGLPSGAASFARSSGVLSFTICASISASTAAWPFT